MLKGISPLLPPELVKLMMEMGHGDTLVIGDANFPSASVGQRCIRCDGLRGRDLLAAILALYPLDAEETKPVGVMRTADSSQPPIWAEYEAVIAQKNGARALTEVERFAFYEEARKAYVVVASGETALYANLILRKGVVTGQ